MRYGRARFVTGFLALPVLLYVVYGRLSRSPQLPGGA